MGYKLLSNEVNNLFEELKREYMIYAPKRFLKQGRYSDTDIIKYGEVNSFQEIVYKEKSTYPAKELITPINQTLYFFTEDEFRESKNPYGDKKILIFRDSYQAPTTWLFADLFSEVEIVDPRNIDKIDKTYEEIIKDSNSDIVMFMYNSSGFDSMVKAMIDKGVK